MRKASAILFLTLYLISATELSQLLKFPVLVGHFIEHKEKNPEMSFIDFLSLHYNSHLENHPRDDDFDQDQKLPFLLHADVLSFYFIYTPPYFFETNNKIITSQQLKILAGNDISFYNHFLSTIWQPPKFC